MAQTYQQVRQLTAIQTGLKFLTGTADSGGSSTIMTDDALARFGDKELIAHHILLSSGTPSFTELFIENSFQQDGDVQFRPELAQAPDGLTYEILPFSATDFLRAISDAILHLYDAGLLARNHWMRIVAGSPIYNADFGYWTSATAVDGWTANTVSVARERASANLAISETSVRLHTAAGFLSLDEQYQRYLNDYKDYTVTLYCWVKTSAASTARIALYDGSTINYSAYHGGDGDWELLHVEVTTDELDTAFQPRLYIDTTSQAYFSLPFITGGPRARTYPFAHQIMPDGPSEIQLARIAIEEDQVASGRGIASIRQLGPRRNITSYRVIKHHDENASTQVGVLDFTQPGSRPPTDELVMLLRGDGPLTVPTTVLSTDNIEVTQSEGLLLATVAAINLLERASIGAPSTGNRTHVTRLNELRLKAAELSIGAGEARDSATYHIGW